MKNQNCNLCGSANKKNEIKQNFKDKYLSLINPEYNALTRHFCLCLNCGHLFRDLVLDSNDLKILYEKFRDTSFRRETPDEYFDRISNYPKGESENLEKLDWLKEALDNNFNKIKSVLDIGCGGGVFLKKFKDVHEDCKFFGVEPTQSFADLAFRKLGIQVYTGEYESNIYHRKFDLITANQVLEHVLDPVSFMFNIFNDLENDGLVYIEVPDISDIKQLHAEHDRFLMQHISIFSSESMKYLMKKCHLRILKLNVVSTIRKRNNIVCLAKKIHDVDN